MPEICPRCGKFMRYTIEYFNGNPYPRYICDNCGYDELNQQIVMSNKTISSSNQLSNRTEYLGDVHDINKDRKSNNIYFIYDD